MAGRLQHQAPPKDSVASSSHDDLAAGGRDMPCRPFRVRPEARKIWQQHTGGTVGFLLGQPSPPAVVAPGLPSVTAGGTECVNAREKLRTNRSHGRHSGGGRQPMRALPINGVTEEALSHSKSSSSAASFVASPGSPRRHIDLGQLNGDLSAVEGVRGVRVISPGRQHVPAENGRFPSPGEGIISPKEGFRVCDEGISSPRGFRRVSSSGDIGSGSLSSGATLTSSAADLNRYQMHVASPASRHNHSGNVTNYSQSTKTLNGDRLSSPFDDEGIPSRNPTHEGFPSHATNGERFPSSRTNGGEGIPSLSSAPSWPDRTHNGDGDVDVQDNPTRSVRLTVPNGNISDRSSESDLRRERIRALIGSLRRSPTDGSSRDLTSEVRQLYSSSRQDTSRGTASTGRVSEPPVTRFSDETRLSFREQALERAKAPYRAPSIVNSRKFKSSETLRDGAVARAAPEAPNRLLNKRKSQSVTKLARAGDEHGAMRSGDKRGVVSTRNDAASRVAPTSHPPPITDSSNSTNTSSNHSPSHTPGKTVPISHPSSQESSETPKDFVRLNRRMASQRSRRARSVPRRGEEAAAVKPKTQPGSLPRYLVRRQQQWADEERRRIEYLVRRQQQWADEERRRIESAPDPACPPGHIRMADGERLQTLDVLKENHVTLLSELRSLPIAHTSSRLVAQRADLERQLQKVEEGIRIFSRPKVFIKNDA